MDKYEILNYIFSKRKTGLKKVLLIRYKYLNSERL